MIRHAKKTVPGEPGAVVGVDHAGPRQLIQPGPLGRAVNDRGRRVGVAVRIGRTEPHRAQLGPAERIADEEHVLLVGDIPGRDGLEPELALVGRRHMVMADRPLEAPYLVRGRAELAELGDCRPDRPVLALLLLDDGPAILGHLGVDEAFDLVGDRVAAAPALEHALGAQRLIQPYAGIEGELRRGNLDLPALGPAVQFEKRGHRQLQIACEERVLRMEPARQPPRLPERRKPLPRRLGFSLRPAHDPLPVAEREVESRLILEDQRMRKILVLSRLVRRRQSPRPPWREPPHT